MNVLDLFCGAVGGWSKGLERAGYRTVAACEIDPWRRAVFAAQHPGCVMYGDVRELDADRLRADLGYLPDIIVGSPPCQEVSFANTKGKGITDDHLFWEWARLVFEVRPVWCAAENSPNARTAGIDGILDALEKGGYASWPLVVGAEDVGANHPRKRMWLIAADAHRSELWQQPGRSGRTSGRDAAVSREHDPDAAGIGPDRLRPTAGWAHERPGLAGDALPDASDAHGRLPGGPGRHAAGVAGLRQRRIRTGRSAEPAQAGLHDAAHSNREGLAIGPRLVRDITEELPPALRDIGRAWPDWNGGLAGLAASCATAGFGALDDGPGSLLPPGLRNRAIAALGDAVIPQIPYAIARAMIQICPPQSVPPEQTNETP